MAKIMWEHSTAIRRKIKGGIFLLFAAALMVAALGPQRVFACDVTDVDLWIGDTQTDAEQKNTDAVSKSPGETFGWYVEWDADWPDYQDFYGEIFLAGTRVDTFTAGPTDRNESGTATVPSTMSCGDKSVRAWMRRVDGEWYASNTRTLIVEGDCGPSGSCTALSDAEWSNAESLYPNLVRCNVCKEAPADPEYNCIAWTIGVTNDNIWYQIDVPGPPYYGNNNGHVEVSEFDTFYAYHGVPAILYGTGPGPIYVPKHAAIPLSDNCASSKRGGNIRMRHDRNELEGGYYDDIIKTY